MLKLALFSLSLFGSSFCVLAEEPPAAAATEKAPTAVISAVAVEGNKKTLAVHYERNGKSAVERITFPKEIADFRYCRWMEVGVAIVARVGTGDETGYYLTNFYFSDAPMAHKPALLPVPPGIRPVLGIGNTAAIRLS